jgi:nucleotide-binding universal stress UspA family protein
MEADMLSKILVPLDGSEMASQVFPALAELAVAFKSEVDLLGFCQPGATDEVPICAIYIRNEAAFLSAMTGSAATIKREYATTEIESEIKNYISENQVDLIMFAAHEKKGIEPWSLEQTVNRLMHVSGTPLLVVRSVSEGHTADKDIFKNILVPLDASEKSTCILPMVIELGKKFESKITLMQVVEKEHRVHTIGGLDSVSFREEDFAKEIIEAQNYLDDLSNRFAISRANMKIHVALGEAADEIQKYAGDNDVSLIAMSSYLHSVLESWFYGNVTKEIIQSGRCSFLFMSQPSD